MHIAAAYNHVEILRAFLVLGIDVNKGDSRLGYTPLHHAAAVDHIAVLECLHASGQCDFLKKANNVSQACGK